MNIDWKEFLGKLTKKKQYHTLKGEMNPLEFSTSQFFKELRSFVEKMRKIAGILHKDIDMFLQWSTFIAFVVYYLLIIW